MHSGHKTNDDPWGVLIALAVIIMIATTVAIIALYLLWKRYVKQRTLFEQSLHGIEVPTINPKEYEVQSLDMFVPTEDRDDLGEVHIGFSPNHGINSIHRVKEVPVTPSQMGSPIGNESMNYIDRSEHNYNSLRTCLQGEKLYRRVMHYSKLSNSSHHFSLFATNMEQ